MSKTYMTSHWAHLMATRHERDPALAAYLRRLERPNQIAFHRLMAAYGGHPVGVECVDNEGTRWAFAVPNVQTRYRAAPWRVQTFDVHGFIGHETHTSFTEAIESLVRSYPVIDAGALERCVSTKEWDVGQALQEWRDRHLRGDITFEQMLSGLRSV